MIDERLELALPKQAGRQMVRVQPFKAFDHDGREVQVVAIAGDSEDLDFVVIKTGEDGDELWPAIEGSVFKTGLAA
ncbi:MULTISPECIES: hypothetical protein [unclassified Ensifer]|uniref:hypothetical protein n=1 Tax=unclassified Ensifer TaxID=2633371 RepID=UPI000812ECA1|nr:MULTISPECIES: hypothetical protein [unclassified Ensifer]OCO99783.1 hypothetical protein BC362_25095 [Ensifer sp. LC14]OCP06135.1 hypothetical protein BBX50_24000 [Ensifer sp. LC11]OCP07084.1 hypothetical protein BC374_24220 [Ensifer sp. LC13]OCP31462.1 hypothetical protein BC364_23435 [Ensifer sp. LC499]